MLGVLLDDVDDKSFMLKRDKKFMLHMVKMDVDLLKYADPMLNGDEKFMLDAVEQHGDALEHASEMLKSDATFLNDALKRNAEAMCDTTSQSEITLSDREMEGRVNGFIESITSNQMKVNKADLENLAREVGVTMGGVESGSGIMKFVDMSNWLSSTSPTSHNTQALKAL